MNASSPCMTSQECARSEELNVIVYDVGITLG